MTANDRFNRDLAKMVDKHDRDIVRLMKRYGVDFMKFCFTLDEKGKYKVRIKSHIRDEPTTEIDPDQLSMQSVGEQMQ